MDKIWLKEYPPGIPADIDPTQYRSLKQIFEECCARYRDLPAYTNMGRSITYGELDQLTRYFGAFLQQNAGLEKGDRVALMMPNILQYPLALFAALRAGMTVVNCNPLYTPRELEHQLRDSGARAIVILENFAPTLQKVLERTDVKTVVTTELGDMFAVPKRWIVNFVVKRVKKLVPEWQIPDAIGFGRALAEGKWQTLEEVELSGDDIAFLQYTGGTTGLAKGAILTHGNMVANLLQAEAWLSPLTSAGREVVITALPLYHIFALTANCLVFMRLGGNNILITNPRDFPAFVKELNKYRFTFFSGVNTLFNALLNTPGFAELDFSQLRVTLGGGMAVQEAVAKRWKEVTGNTLTQAYGLTETAPAACINPLVDHQFNGSIGLPISSTEASIRGDDGAALSIGEIGELCIRGPQVMAGYWQQPEETAKVMIEGGWLRTGDIARMDERGYIYIEDRKKDMILVSGFNVYPNELEAVAVTHPDIVEAAAVGVQDERSGEVVKLFVVSRNPALTAEQVIAFMRGEVTAYKVPKWVEFRSELPKTNVGKILRRALRDEPSPSPPLGERAG